MTDIAPVQSLVAQVTGTLGAPDVLLGPGASPHGFALRPSQARALQQADIVIWIGPELTPWLTDPLATLSPSAQRLALLQAPGTRQLTFDDDHAHAHDDDDHGHDHAQAHGDTDPHAWLDPGNGIAWLAAIAEALAEADPGNAALYRENAARAAHDLAALDQRLADQLAAVHDRPFVTAHDGYGYFETRYDLTNAGAVRSGDATDPGPASVADLRATLRDHGVRCAFGEPQNSNRLLTMLAGDADVTVALLDPLGSGLEPGPALYARLLENLAETVAACLGAGG
ncbi:zinc transporter [Pukyongiella litopenaei]|uniref:High-affinity zinc uptake system protein ZnuA n=2 Tax=Pukyongiella litopenaei TaxID=2605946 RepID=A0A2S0MUJ5_9RHOB|nr:zinc transporter [Pukyongiella litopenaei]